MEEEGLRYSGVSFETLDEAVKRYEYITFKNANLNYLCVSTQALNFSKEITSLLNSEKFNRKTCFIALT